ncbi:hypothetical protein CCACVL1_10324 [Corchorus capsularis]|uniref:DUF1639 family protein n=1 Tax=Corchorus capsularis TaxID=210143 RepID=A0A1R3IRQ7_COCAP|nr:hypothetical protein CCACVL1_10324 [Corchorus capsularis]
MVFSGERGMTMGPERSKPLHNFELPCLKWGNQKYLRCMKLDDASTATDSSSAAAGGHYQRPRHTFQRRRSPPSKFESLVVGEVEARPWNLRTRRAACKAPVDGGVTNNNSNSPMKIDVMKSPRVRDRGASVQSASAAAAAASEKKRPRAKLSVPLSKKEIEEDFMAMAGHRPPRRPKKRPRHVQKQLDSLFPGLWLTEVTADFYKVPELVENGKR